MAITSAQRSLWRRWQNAPPGPEKEALYNEIRKWEPDVRRTSNVLPANAGATTAPSTFGTSPNPFANFTRKSADALLKRAGPILKPDPEAVGTGATAYRGILSKMPGMSTEVYDKMLKQAEDSARLNMALAMMQAGFGAAAAPRERGESTFSTLSRTLFQPLSVAAMQTMGAARKEKMAAQLGKLQAEGRLSTAAFQAAMADETTARKTLAAMLGKKGAPIKTRKGADAEINIGTKSRPDRKLVSTSTQTDGQGRTRIVLDADAYGYKSGKVLKQGDERGQIRLVKKGDGKGDQFTYDKKEFVISDKVLGILTRNRIKVDPDIKGKKGTFRIAIPKPGTDGTTQFDLTVGATTFDLSKMSEKDRSALGLIEPPSADEDGSIGTQDYYLQDAEGNLKEDAKGNPQVVRFYISGKKAGQAIKQGGGEIDISGLEAVKVPSHSDLKSAAEAGYFVLVDEATGTIQHDALGFPITARQQGSIWIRPNTTEAYEPPLNTLFKPASDYFKAKPKEPDAKGIRSEEFLEGDYLSGAGDLAGVWTSLERFRPEGKERGTLGVNAEAAIRGDFPFTMPDGSPIQEDLRKPIWDAYKGLIWRRTRGAKNVEFGPIIKKANEDFLKRSIYNMGMEPPRGPGVEPRPRPRVTNFKMAQEAMEAAKTPGADVKALFGNVDVTALDSKDLTSSSGKMVVAVNSAPDLFGEKTVGDTDDIQGRADREKAARTQFLDTGQSTAKWFNDLGISSDKVTSDRRKQFSGQSADQALELLQDSTRMLKEVRSFQNAMLATKGAVGWLKGNALDALLSTIGTEWFEKNDDFANLKVEGDRHQSGLSRKTGREWGDTRISNFDAEDYKLMNAAMGKSVTLNKSLLDKYERKLLDNIRTAMKQIGVANFDKVTIEDAIKAGADISGITPKNNFYSPYFKNKFALSNQPMPRHSDEYIQGLRKEGELERKLYKGSYLVPVIDASGALIPGKAPDKITAEDLEVLRNTNPPLYKKKRELINFLWNQSYGKLK